MIGLSGTTSFDILPISIEFEQNYGRGPGQLLWIVVSDKLTVVLFGPLVQKSGQKYVRSYTLTGSNPAHKRSVQVNPLHVMKPVASTVGCGGGGAIPVRRG